ncbi:hypothetical protein L9F63_008777 [Diploptera punctata]|uniref:Nanos-type domain-containing protein n=1 Tax=Diploptera punctata TaxID=6984 RepID=A0AAD8E1F6_DIPPU|nr:hypothetical protein L9F63_008777 [Diploptera punctata]
MRLFYRCVHGCLLSNRTERISEEQTKDAGLSSAAKYKVFIIFTMNIYIDPDFPTFYPLNKSLQDELKRLFEPRKIRLPYIESLYISSSVLCSVQDEFKFNGTDSEYSPDSSPTNCSFAFDLIKPIAAKTVAHSKKRSKKIAQGCAFCKNNGEEERYYKGHTLKDSMGKITCPILKAYVCPICGANGEVAHTIKYCPQNTKADDVPTIVKLKSHLSASGQKRNKCF